jgi:hypothetical protein
LLHDYFRAPSAEAVRARMDGDDGSPLAGFDGEDLKNLDPALLLPRLAGPAAEHGAGTDLIWPEDPTEWDGPWVVAVDDRTRDALAGITADQVADEELREPARRLIALAGRARAAGDGLFCWMSL